MGHTYRGGKSGCKLVTLFGGYTYDGVSAGIWVIHTEVPNLGARWSRFLAVTLMIAECWYTGHTYRGPKYGCKMVSWASWVCRGSRVSRISGGSRVRRVCRVCWIRGSA